MKRYLIALLAAVMMTAIVACGTDKKPETDSVKEPVTEESISEESNAEEGSDTLSDAGEFSVTIEDGEQGAFAQ